MAVRWLVIGALAVANLAILPYFLFLLAVSVRALFARRARGSSASQNTRFLVIIPAHDEEPVIATTVRSCLSANYPPSRFSVLVIADNCSDRTASVAQAAGARVVERFDPDKKTKGYALEFLIESLQRSSELEQLDALVVIDADTTIDPHLLHAFDDELEKGNDWIQAYYTVANPDQSWRTRLMKYAFSLYNGVLLLGQNALGWSASLKGNGMCFAVRGLRRIPWKCYGLVEDMEYSWTLRIAGEKIVFRPDASVYGTMLSAGGPAAVEQRRRWEIGRSDVRRNCLNRLLRSQNMGIWEKTISVCELTLPSLAGLALLYGFLLTCDLTALLTRPSHENPIVSGCLLASILLMTLALVAYGLCPFVAMRLPWRYLWSVFCFPFYLGWKLMVAAKGRPERWVRTAREVPQHETSAEVEDNAPTTTR